MNLSSLIFALISFAIRQIHGQGYQCCGFSQMDSEGLVLVEATRPLTQGRFQALKFRGCGYQPLSIQLWTCDLAALTCSFKWQTSVQTIAVDQSTNIEALDIGPNDRLGVYAPFSSTNLFSVPFGTDNLAFLYKSSSRYSDASGFTSGTQMNLSRSALPRSFAKSIVFCENKDCVGLPTDALASTAVIRDSPNQPPLGQCCKSQMGCDPLPLGSQLGMNDYVIQQLRTQIDQLNELIVILTDQARPVTGICPQGFTAGTYGLGSCYAAFYSRMTFAVASFYCRDNFVANLVSIGSDMEQQFLAKYIGSQAGGPGNFWTSGMYQWSDQTWYWYDKRSESLQYQQYKRWKNDNIPYPSTKYDVCSNLVVENNNGNRSDYWVQANCNDRQFFICEVAKICF